MPSAIAVYSPNSTASESASSRFIASRGRSKHPARIANKIATRKSRVTDQRSRPMENGDRTDALSREAAGWRCTSCGALITSVEDGWVEWLATEGEQGRTLVKGLRLVHRDPTVSETSNSITPHQAYCRYDSRREFRNDKSIVEGLPLERFVGPDGLMLLLSFLADGEAPKDDVLELAKRVQIPGYEQARGLFQEALDEKVVAPVIREGYYLQSEIDALFRWARLGFNDIRSSGRDKSLALPRRSPQ